MEEQGQGEKPKNKETVSLGGGIILNGFQDIPGMKMIVLKKIIGTNTKQIQEKKSDYEKLEITLEGEESNATIKITLTAGGNSIASEDTQNNIFMALGNALQKILEQI